MDTQLDLSLDELIKKRRQSDKGKTSSQPKVSQKGAKKDMKQSRQQAENVSSRRGQHGRRGGRHGGKQAERKPERLNQRRPATEKKRNHLLPKQALAITKASQRQSNTIASRLSSKAAAALGPPSTQPRRPTPQSATTTTKKIDPASIVITKFVGRKQTQNSQNVPVMETFPPQHADPIYQRSPQPVGIQPAARERGLAIRSAAYGAELQHSPQLPFYGNGLSIRGESGPATVLISNLDPRASEDDIRMICSQFGQVNHCEALVDRKGVSFGEAEVEFALKTSAMDCINRLNNEIADGRVLRASLRHTPVSLSSSPSGYMSQQVRSAVTPARFGFA